MTTQFRRTGRWAGVLLVSALSVTLAACDISVGDSGFSVGVLSGKATDTWTRTYPMTGGAVEIANVNGLIDVSEGGTAVEVRAERTAKAASDEAAKELLGRIEMKEEVSGTRVRIEAKLPPGGGIRQGLEIRYRVRVPAGVAVKMETTNGRIALNGLTGRAEAETTNGAIAGEDLAGPVKASTVNGGVNVAVKSVAEGGIEMSAVNGAVRLTLPRDAKADIDAICTNGGVRMTDLDVQTTENSRRRVSGRLNGGGPRVRLETTNGGIRLTGR